MKRSPGRFKITINDLENEANRTALNLEPVALNTDEVYDILRKRLFIECPSAASLAVNMVNSPP